METDSEEVDFALVKLSVRGVSVLREIHPGFEDFEVGELVFWGNVEERLKNAGIKYKSAYRPESIPPKQV